MSDEIVVSDASALIGFERIGQIDLMGCLFGTIIVPPAVAREVGPSITSHGWLREQSLSEPIPLRPLLESLRSPRFFIDDKRVRQLLEEFGED